MSFLLQRIDGAAVTLQRVDSAVLRIGRGTDAQVRSDNVAVAMSHAAIETVPEGYLLVDRGSITGTYVNGAPADRRLLEKGDVIEIGDLRFTVQEASPHKPLFTRVERTVKQGSSVDPNAARRGESATIATGDTLEASTRDYQKAYSIRGSWITRRSLSWVALVLAAVLAGHWMSGESGERFMPGPLSAAHSMARTIDGRPVIPANACHACHADFEGPSDALCQDCHPGSTHQTGAAEAGECKSCHAEHRRQESLAGVSDRRCIDCHRDLSTVGGGEGVARAVTAFGENHPELTLLVSRDPEIRIPAGSAQLAKADPTSLRFDHECHLRGDCRTRPPTAGDPRRTAESLDCSSCHQMDAATGDFRDVSYEEHCGRCHVLSFDNRFAALPHGLPLEAVSGMIANAYAGSGPLISRNPTDAARIISRSDGGAAPLSAKAVRVAQMTVQGRCEECHTISEGRIAVPARYTSVFPGIRSFDHAVHSSAALGLQCESCHVGIASSRESATLSMPAMAQCAGCHGSAAGAAPAGLAGCTTCHYYHSLTRQHGEGWTVRTASLGVPAKTAARDPRQGSKVGQERAWMGIELTPIQWVLAGAVILLAFVAGVLLVGWATLRREKRKFAEQAGAASRRSPFAGSASPAAPAPPRSPTPDAPDPRPAPGAVAPSSEVTETVMLRKAKTHPDAPEGATVAVVWKGSIVWTAGPHEGLRLPLDDGGFYIGRDKDVAQLVIEDSRISRKHVWVGIRDGKPMVIDQSSTNGTFLNSRNNRIGEAELSPGDEVILSEDVARFRFDA